MHTLCILKHFVNMTKYEDKNDRTHTIKLYHSKQWVSVHHYTCSIHSLILTESITESTSPDNVVKIANTHRQDMEETDDDIIVTVTDSALKVIVKQSQCVVLFLKKHFCKHQP